MQTKASHQDALIFLHILKTGGTTLNMILENYFPPERSFATFPNRHHPGGSLEAFYELSEAEKANIDLLTGHMGFGLHRNLPRSAVYITLIRDPIERVISHYYQELRSPDGQLHELIQEGLELADFVKYYANSAAQMDNLQTRMLAGNWEKRGYGPCTSEMLATAKENLKKHFLLAGITKQFDAFFLLLRRLRGWPSVLYVPHNVGAKRPQQNDFSPETLAVVHHYNQFDIQLYDFVKAQFSAKVQAQGPDFARELKRTQWRNRLFQLYLQFRSVSVREMVRKRAKVR